MFQPIDRVWHDESGQDIVEYSLLMTFIAIACMWVLGAGRPAVNGVWTSSNSTLTSANTVAGS